MRPSARIARALEPAPKLPAGIRNRLLGALSPEAFAPLRPHLEAVTLPVRAVLFAPPGLITHVYFPETAVLSLVRELGGGGTTDDRALDGQAVEVGTVGCEGMAGLAVFLDGRPAEASHGPPSGASGDGARPAPPGVPPAGVRAVAQVAGAAQRMEAASFAALARAPGPLHQILLHYTHAYLTQVGQTAACNAGHRLEARCARWLLMTADRVAGDTLPLPLEFLAVMLGVQRAGAAMALNALRARGLVTTECGGVRVLDRPGLEAAACACYRAVRAEYARLLGPDPRAPEVRAPEAHASTAATRGAELSAVQETT